MESVLANIGLSSVVIVEDFIHCVALSLACALAKIQRFHVQTVITEQRISQYKEVIELAIAACSEATAIGILAFIAALHGVHAGCSGFHPHEFPVVIEVVGEEFARFKRGVSEGTWSFLGIGHYRCTA